MKPVWILVLGRAGARFLERRGTEKKVHLVEEIPHPEGRLKEGQMVTDRSGREFDTVHKVSHSGGHSGEARVHSDQIFMKDVSTRLNKARKEGLFSRLYLVADSHLVGMLRPHLEADTLHLVAGTVEKDLSKMAEADLFPALSGSLMP